MAERAELAAGTAIRAQMLDGRSIAYSALLSRAAPADKPIVILSGNSVDHARSLLVRALVSLC